MSSRKVRRSDGDGLFPNMMCETPIVVESLGPLNKLFMSLLRVYRVFFVSMNDTSVDISMFPPVVEWRWSPVGMLMLTNPCPSTSKVEAACPISSFTVKGMISTLAPSVALIWFLVIMSMDAWEMARERKWVSWV